MRCILTALLLLVVSAPPGVAGDLHAYLGVSLGASRDLGFEGLSFAVFSRATWEPDDRWAVEGLLTQRWAEKAGVDTPGDQFSQTAWIEGCHYTGASGLRLCLGSYHSSFVTPEWEKVGYAGLASLGWRHRWDDGDQVVVSLWASEGNHVEPEISSLGLWADLWIRSRRSWPGLRFAVQRIRGTETPIEGWQVESSVLLRGW